MASETKNLVPETKARDLVQISTNKLPYTTTTNDCGKYLQRKFDALSQVRTTKGGTALNVSVRLNTIAASKRFYPLFVTLPLSVVTTQTKASKGSSIFAGNQDQKMVELDDGVFEVLKKYMYDKETLLSSDYQKEVQISRQTADQLRNLRTPRIKRIGNEKYVVCLIDPIKLLHEMLEEQGNPNAQAFRVMVQSVDKMQDGNFRYSVVRSIDRNNKKKGGVSFEAQLEKVIKNTK